MKNTKEFDSHKKEIIKHLNALSDNVGDFADAHDDNQMLFIADSMKVLLHAAHDPHTAAMFHKHINKYVMEFALLTKQITMKEFIKKTDVLKELAETN